jgi:hypothetical protein
MDPKIHFWLYQLYGIPRGPVVLITKNRYVPEFVTACAALDRKGFVVRTEQFIYRVMGILPACIFIDINCHETEEQREWLATCTLCTEGAQIKHVRLP